MEHDDTHDSATRRRMARIAEDLPRLLGFTPTNEMLAIPVHFGAGPLPTLRISMEDPQALSPAGYADAGRLLYANGVPEQCELALFAATRDTSLGRQVLDRARMFLGYPISGRVIVDGEHWHDIDRGTTGQVRPAHLPTAREATALAAQLSEGRHTWVNRVLESQESYAAERAWVTKTIDQAATTGRPLNDRDAARMLLGLNYIELRDHAIAGVNATNAHAHVAMWVDLANRAPHQDLTPAATVAAVCLFLDSQPDRAQAMLDQAPERDSYTLARLLNRILEVDADPRDFGPSPQIPLTWPPPRAAHPSLQSEPLATRPAPTATPTRGIDASGTDSPAR